MPRRISSPTRRVSILDFSTAVIGFVAMSILAGVLAAALVLPGIAVAGLAAKSTIEVFDSLPAELEFQGLPQASNIYFNDGETLIATFFDQNRIVVPLEEISPWIQKAVVAVEDKRFWTHNGVDGEGLIRAIVHNASTGETQGASTLTQQLVKNILVNAARDAGDDEAVAAATEVSAARKLGEARRALALEAKYNEELGTECTADPHVDCGKEQVLEQYLNIAQFGRSVYGVEAASMLYFGKSAAELNAIEAATMAGITQNPYKWDPLRFPDNATERRNVVLSVMREQDIITETEYQEYIATPIEETLDVHEPKFSCVASVDAPFFCDYVTKVITNDPFFEGKGKEYLYYGADIVTTLDLTMQRIANEELRKAIPPTDPTGIANALVALEPSTGHILAMAQNRDFNPTPENTGQTAINYAVDNAYGGSRGFSPGSTFKVILLAEWLEEGHSFEQAVSGEIREWPSDSWKASCIGPAPFAGQASWKPTNVNDTGSKQQTALSATAWSINTSYIAMTNQLDLCGVRDMAERLGFQRADGKDFEVVPSATLGTQNASPLTMAVVGATIANDGIRCEPRSIKSITTLDGVEIAVPPDSCERVIESKIAKGVQYGMTQVITAGSGTAAKLSGGRQAAGKTGTAQNNTHLWFLGFTPQLATVVWTGHPDHDVPIQYIRINGVYYTYGYGGSVSGPVWKKFMDRALAGKPNIAMPYGPPAGLGWLPLEVPDIIGKTEEEARNLINDAGFMWLVSPVVVFDESVPNNTVIEQSVLPGESLAPGATIVYKRTMSTLPDWWFTWPATWDPCVAPKSWWGSSWPPSDWGPADGWDSSGCVAPEPTPTPTPSPS
ncbi:MAG: penicillin-binding protein [Demequinaceae bacterium]|nr:penicillin-binding protein [Demequinaceae bacterium]